MAPARFRVVFGYFFSQSVGELRKITKGQGFPGQLNQFSTSRAPYITATTKMP
ncbi:hypothetical protein Rleg4DRAFT_2229 [Rhizobium leguminosarum bv. trifolii WSM2297]|uniref:Uncharacterized protein n=1 Tax=Rhizobium leguminosarum bv. trifolii WSM2297 TaxID=754762 RepID=J0CLZ6_RHILT|nr:hypothetical protein Rleg4DRAFT_2229 [Rhizobium leguminosarum bv. trifolii WSM2297]